MEQAIRYMVQGLWSKMLSDFNRINLKYQPGTGKINEFIPTFYLIPYTLRPAPSDVADILNAGL